MLTVIGHLEHTRMFLNIVRRALRWKVRVRHGIHKGSVTLRPLLLDANHDERRQHNPRCLQVPELSIDATYSYCAEGATGSTAWFPRG